MGLETGTYISDLVPTNPVGTTDGKNRGDDHLRLIKQTLLNTFPNINSQVTATDENLNQLTGIITPVIDQAALLSPPVAIGGVAPGAGTFTTLNATTSLSVAGVAVARSTTQVIAGNGLIGGGNLTQDRTLNVNTGTGLAISGDAVQLNHLGFQNLTDPNDDRVVFWDDSASQLNWLDLGTGLTLSGTVLSVLPSGINHDTLAGFNSNKHIDHTTVQISAGTGLTGGGAINTSRTLSLDTGNTRNVDHAGVQVVAGTMLSGGGAINATRTLNVDFSEAPVATDLGSGDYIMYYDTGSARGERTLPGNVPLSIFNNDAGFVSSAVTSVTAGDGLDGGGTGAVTLSMEAASTSNRGGVLLATTADTVGGTNSTEALTSAGFAGTKSLASSGYYVLPGNLVLQWGYRSNTGTGIITQTFPRALTTCYSVVIGQDTSSASGSSRPVVVESISATSFDVYVAGDVGTNFRSFYWFAIGLD